MKPKIYVALSTFAQSTIVPKDLLLQAGVEFAINPTGVRLTREQVIECCRDYDAVIAGLEPYDAQVIEALSRLKCISRCGVGLDNIDLKAAAKHKITVMNTPDAVIQPVAELTIAMIFDLLRQVTVHTELMRRHQWEKKTGTQLAGKTIGIIGLGRIGRKVAELLIRLDCKVIAVDLKPDTVWAKAHRVELADLDAVLSQSDVLSLHVTAAEGQTFQLSKRHFEVMKKGVYLVNTARGSLINEQDLQEALLQGHVAGAALDVFAKEPYQGPLCGMPNVLLSPHVATLTHESRAEMEIGAVNNIIHWLRQRT